MWIVGGSIELEPETRAAFLKERIALMTSCREEPGCVEYSFCPDLVDENRVILFELWESKEALDVHAAAAQHRAVRPSNNGVLSRSIFRYEVAASEPLP